MPTLTNVIRSFRSKARRELHETGTSRQYIMKQRPSRQPVHPGEILRDEVIPATGLSVTEVSRRLGVSRQNLYRVLSGKGAITPEMALRLGRFCGNGPGIWLRLQQAHDLWEAERRLRPELRKMVPAPDAQALS